MLYFNAISPLPAFWLETLILLFQLNLPFPPPQLPIAKPLTVPDFPPPFYSNQHVPILLPPPVQDNLVSVLDLIRSIESQQQIEIAELQVYLQSMRNRDFSNSPRIVQHVEQTKIDLLENLILLCNTKLQSIHLVCNLNNTTEHCILCALAIIAC